MISNDLHLSLAELERGLQALSLPPRDVGRVALIVRRPTSGVHDSLDAVRLTTEEGIPDDHWNRGSRKLDAQLTVIRRDVSELISNGQPLTTSGDNFVVHLDISTPNLPAGTRLRVGQALVEVTPMPHNGCKKFAARFGADAARFVQAPATRHLNLRGIHWKVIEPGEVKVGDEVRPLR